VIINFKTANMLSIALEAVVHCPAAPDRFRSQIVALITSRASTAKRVWYVRWNF
jgi:hypothetical protein